jgi:ABC-type uncharacterized transport system permease subunit
VSLTALGWVVHTAYLVNLAWHTQRLPITTLFDSLLVLSWILAAIDLYLIVRSPRPLAVGVFVLPVVLVLVAIAGLYAPRSEWSSWGGPVFFWVTVHVMLLVGGAVSTCVALVAGLMYLVQANRLKHKRPPRFGFALPSLEQLERLNQAAITVAFPLLTFGLLIGAALILSKHEMSAPPIGWTDPKVVSAGVMWLVFAVLLNARFRPAMRGRRVMLLTVVAFAFLVFTWVGVNLVLPTAHGVTPSYGRTL